MHKKLEIFVFLRERKFETVNRKFLFQKLSVLKFLKKLVIGKDKVLNLNLNYSSWYLSIFTVFFFLIFHKGLINKYNQYRWILNLFVLKNYQDYKLMQ